MYFDKTEEVSYSIEDDYRDESNEILTEICEENSDDDEEPSNVEAEEDTAAGTDRLMIFLKIPNEQRLLRIQKAGSCFFVYVFDTL